MPQTGRKGRTLQIRRVRSFGCRRIPRGGAFPSRRSVPNVSRFARNTPLRTKKLFLFYLRFFLKPPLGGKKEESFFALGVWGFFKVLQWAMFHDFAFLQERGHGGEDSPLQRDDGRTRGKTPQQNGFLLFSLKGVARAFRRRGGLLKKTAPQRLERDKAATTNGHPLLQFPRKKKHLQRIAVLARNFVSLQRKHKGKLLKRWGVVVVRLLRLFLYFPH